MKVASIRHIRASLAFFLRNPSSAFLTVAVAFGSLFIFLTPPMQAPDEHHHFFRAYQISTGNLVPDIIHSPQDSGVGGFIPNSIKLGGYQLLGDLPGHPEHKIDPKLIHKYLEAPVDEAQIGFAHFEPGSSSSPLPYLPQALGIKLADLLGGSVLQLFYVGRIFNFVTWLSLAYMAIRLIPVGRWLYVLVLLSPVVIFQAASLSPDAATNALSFLYVALVARLATSKGRLELKLVAAVLVLAACLALCKQAYFIIGMVGLIIPSSRFSGRRTHWSYIGALVLACVIPPAVWGTFASHFLPLLNQVFQPGKVVSPVEQIRHALFHPFTVILTIIKTVFTSFSDYLFLEFYGRIGWSDVRLPVWVPITEYAVLAFVWLSDVPAALAAWQKRLASAVLIGVIGALAAVVYLTWTPVGDTVIRGLQGRYFIPVVALLVLLIPSHKILGQTSPILVRRIAIISPIIVLVITAATLYVRYY